MPTAEQIAVVYDFPRVMEVALKALFTARDLKAFTSQFLPSTGNADEDAALQAAGWEILDYQLDRPRVELMFVPGAGQGRFRPTTLGAVEVPVETSWTGQFKLDCITLAEIRIHSAFVTMVRFIMHTQLLSVNGNALTLHKIQTFQKDSGTTPAMKAQEGSFQTTMLFDIDFSIQEDAWATLDS